MNKNVLKKFFLLSTLGLALIQFGISACGGVTGMEDIIFPKIAPPPDSQNEPKEEFPPISLPTFALPEDTQNTPSSPPPPQGVEGDSPTPEDLPPINLPTFNTNNSQEATSPFALEGEVQKEVVEERITYTTLCTRDSYSFTILVNNEVPDLYGENYFSDDSNRVHAPSDNSNIAKATISGEANNVVTIHGLQEGKTAVNVYYKKGENHHYWLKVLVTVKNCEVKNCEEDSENLIK